MGVLCFPCAETIGRADLSLPTYDTCQVLLSTSCTISAQHPCDGRGGRASAFAGGEMGLASSQVFSELASSERGGENTLSLHLRK